MRSIRALWDTQHNARSNHFNVADCISQADTNRIKQMHNQDKIQSQFVEKYVNSNVISH